MWRHSATSWRHMMSQRDILTSLDDFWQEYWQRGRVAGGRVNAQAFSFTHKVTVSEPPHMCHTCIMVTCSKKHMLCAISIIMCNAYDRFRLCRIYSEWDGARKVEKCCPSLSTSNFSFKMFIRVCIKVLWKYPFSLLIFLSDDLLKQMEMNHKISESENNFIRKVHLVWWWWSKLVYQLG